MNDKAQKACDDAIKSLGLTDLQGKYLQAVAKEIFICGEISGLTRGQALVEGTFGKEDK